MRSFIAAGALAACCCLSAAGQGPKQVAPKQQQAISDFRKLTKAGFPGNLEAIEKVFKDCFQLGTPVSALGDLLDSAPYRDRRKLDGLLDVVVYRWEVKRGKEVVADLLVYVGFDPPIVVKKAMPFSW